MRHLLHWDANNQKSTRVKGTQYQDATKGISLLRPYYHLNYDKHTSNVTSLHLFGIKEKGQHK